MRQLVTVVLWKWGGGEYTARHVNAMAAAVNRHLALPHRVVCITDDPAGIDCGTLAIWPEIGVRPGRLNCYRRLRAFAADAGDWLGGRILSLDLDGVIAGDITPLVDVADDFRIWADPTPPTPYNGGMWLLAAGARRQVWEDFDPVASPKAAAAAGYVGSDQAWIGARLGPGEATWGRADGVYSFRCDVAAAGRLPADARVVWFHGRHKPWHPEIRRAHPWIGEHST